MSLPGFCQSLILIDLFLYSNSVLQLSDFQFPFPNLQTEAKSVDFQLSLLFSFLVFPCKTLSVSSFPSFFSILKMLVPCNLSGYLYQLFPTTINLPFQTSLQILNKLK